jgi:hypothetical protein
LADKGEAEKKRRKWSNASDKEFKMSEVRKSADDFDDEDDDDIFRAAFSVRHDGVAGTGNDVKVSKVGIDGDAGPRTQSHLVQHSSKSVFFSCKKFRPTSWRDSVSRPVAPITSVTGGDDTTRPRHQDNIL